MMFRWKKFHFHEVRRKVDAIVDIVGACIGLRITRHPEICLLSRSNVGGGTAKMAQRRSCQCPLRPRQITAGQANLFERRAKGTVTPTGASHRRDSLRYLRPATGHERGFYWIWCGLRRSRKASPTWFESCSAKPAEKVVPGFDEEISVIEANLDDMNPQIYGYFQEKAPRSRRTRCLHHASANEKKIARHASHLALQPQDANALMSLIFAETTTFGARTYSAQRRTLPRESVNVHTQYGDVAIKLSRVNGRILHVAPNLKTAAS